MLKCRVPWSAATISGTMPRPNNTEFLAVKPFPLIVMESPTLPLDWLSDVMLTGEGAEEVAVTVKATALDLNPERFVVFT